MPGMSVCLIVSFSDYLFFVLCLQQILPPPTTTTTFRCYFLCELRWLIFCFCWFLSVILQIVAVTTSSKSSLFPKGKRTMIFLLDNLYLQFYPLKIWRRTCLIYCLILFFALAPDIIEVLAVLWCVWPGFVLALLAVI